MFSSPCSSIKVQVMFLCFAISKYLKSVVTRCTCECISSVLLLPLELKVLVLGKIEVICETSYLSYRIWCLFVFLLLQHVVHIQFQIMVGKPLRYILLSRSYWSRISRGTQPTRELSHLLWPWGVHCPSRKDQDPERFRGQGVREGAHGEFHLYTTRQSFCTEGLGDAVGSSSTSVHLIKVRFFWRHSFLADVHDLVWSPG